MERPTSVVFFFFFCNPNLETIFSPNIYIDKQEGPLEWVTGIRHQMVIQWRGNAGCSWGTLNMNHGRPTFHLERFLHLHTLHPKQYYKIYFICFFYQ
jgi:hypothetical protein